MAVPQGSKPTDWIPNLTGRVDPQVEQAIQFLFRAVYSIRSGNGINTAGLEKITQIILPGITAAAAPALAKSLSPGGSNPITIPPVSPNPQPASITVVTALPGPNDPLSVIGSAVNFEGVQWVYTLIPAISPNPFWYRSAALGVTLQGTHAERLANFPPAGYAIGTNFYESDTGITYQIQNPGTGNIWLYYTGIQRDVLANIPTGLGPDDVLYWFQATDFQHNYNWDGSAWHFSLGDLGSDYLVTSLRIGGPIGGLWGLSDGSTYTVSQDDGTIANVTTTILANQWLRR